MKIGDKITIRYSKKLAVNGNSLLTNRTAIVTRIIVTNGNLTGVYADVRVARRLKNYYIPVASIDGADEVNKIRVLSLLKSTIL